jgi:hypothetical protein
MQMAKSLALVRPRFSDTCVANFRHNVFTALGNFSSGQLIDSAYSASDPGDSVRLEFVRCSYDPAFGTPALPQTSIARVKERGTWTSRKSDLDGRDPDQALPKGAQSDVIRLLV